MPSSHKNSNLTLIHVLRVIVKWLSVAKQDTGMSEQQQRWFTPDATFKWQTDSKHI